MVRTSPESHNIIGTLVYVIESIEALAVNVNGLPDASSIVIALIPGLCTGEVIHLFFKQAEEPVLVFREKPPSS